MYSTVLLSTNTSITLFPSLLHSPSPDGSDLYPRCSFLPGGGFESSDWRSDVQCLCEIELSLILEDVSSRCIEREREVLLTYEYL